MADKKLFIIVNPMAGKKERGRHLAQDFKVFLDAYQGDHRISYEFQETEYGGHATYLTTQAKKKDFTDLVVVGGDGTLNEVINGGIGNSLTLSIIPAGTGNDFVKSLGWPTDREMQYKSIIDGPPALIDLGVCNERKFINTMGLGFDGQVVDTMEKYGKVFSGSLAYLYATAKEMLTYREPKIKFSWEGGEEEAEVFLMAINNGKAFGGGFWITPDAELDDGKLDICLIERFSLLRRFFHLPKAQVGKHQKLKGVRIFRSKNIKIEGDPSIIAQIDGEYLGHPPFEVHIIPNAIRFRSGLL